jgi:pyruvate dehydrogenase E2 component (dihydrolipoamide acetyltransferase)
MAQTVILPKLGQQTEESTIVKWHKKEGDAVRKGDILFEMETDKAVLEAESFFEGTLLKVLVAEGITIPVNTVVGYIGTPGEKVPDAPPPPPPPAPAAPSPAAAPHPAPAAAAPSTKATPVAPRGPQAPAPQPAAVPAAAPAQQAPSRLLISPRAKALADSKVIDPSSIRGSGPGGRIVERDVADYLAAHRYDDLRVSPAAKQLAAREKVDILIVRGTGADGRIMVGDVERTLAERPKPMSKMRQVIAARLTQSFTTTPHIYVTVSIDMTSLMTYRQELKAAGRDFTVTDFILESVVMSLTEFPDVNSSTDGKSVWWHSGVHLGVAVGLENGLVVPVVRDAEQLALSELHEKVATLAQKAREGKLLPDEMTGSTFTVSNMGMMGVEQFGAIINPGEAAILAVGTTTPSAVVRDGKIVVRQIMKITLSADHRIVDGMKAAQFVNAIKSKLEDITLWKRMTS